MIKKKFKRREEGDGRITVGKGDSSEEGKVICEGTKKGRGKERREGERENRVRK